MITVNNTKVRLTQDEFNKLVKHLVTKRGYSVPDAKEHIAFFFQDFQMEGTQ